MSSEGERSTIRLHYLFNANCLFGENYLFSEKL